MIFFWHSSGKGGTFSKSVDKAMINSKDSKKILVFSFFGIF